MSIDSADLERKIIQEEKEKKQQEQLKLQAQFEQEQEESCINAEIAQKDDDETVLNSQQQQMPYKPRRPYLGKKPYIPGYRANNPNFAANPEENGANNSQFPNRGNNYQKNYRPNHNKNFKPHYNKFEQNYSNPNPTPNSNDAPTNQFPPPYPAATTAVPTTQTNTSAGVAYLPKPAIFNSPSQPSYNNNPSRFGPKGIRNNYYFHNYNNQNNSNEAVPEMQQPPYYPNQYAYPPQPQQMFPPQPINYNYPPPMPNYAYPPMMQPPKQIPTVSSTPNASPSKKLVIEDETGNVVNLSEELKRNKYQEYS